ncbi:hypothetical protein EWM64_g10099 [Hericium alpestre]|uniref:FAD dependent oxidoreductase domain-containing protein n=1 Tax=Hericium alpestre TaxID=135208 RepID=A0A4Y9ZJ51_9AGAM|nr:hypothetical protein EWM64_g10099 [Hericium alpestre]
MNRQAALQIDFIIVGGGIAGLASAYALASSGHRVRVLEKLPGLQQPAGGVRVPPNLTKILLEWGLHDELVRRGSKVRPTNLESFETGEIIGYLEWQEDVMKESGAPFFMLHVRALVCLSVPAP